MTRFLCLFAVLLALATCGQSYDFGTSDNPCGREPAGIDLPKRDGWNGYTIALEGYVNPATYVPGKTYQVTLRSTPPVSFKGFFLIALRVDDPDRSAGQFTILDNIQTEVQPGCPYAIKDHAAMTKTRITVQWTAPPAGTGCVVFKATVIQKKKVWFMDDGALSLQLCEGEDTSSNSNDPSLECCACGSPKYKITFQGMWSRRTHRDFPGGYGDHWSDLIGASHTKDYTIWEYGGLATRGVKQVAELGSPIALEREIRAQGGNIKTVITAPGLWPAIGNMTALFRTNRTHNLVSVLSMMGPSPDWCVGISKVNLCTDDCGWEQMKVIDLQPWDAGTDSGLTYRSSNARTIPQEPIHAITSSFPANEASPFYDPTGSPIAPLGKIYLERIELRDTSCDAVDTGENDNLNHGGGGMVKPGMTKPPMMVKPGMTKPPMMVKPDMDTGNGEEGGQMPHKPMMGTQEPTMPPKVMPPKEMPVEELTTEEMPPKVMPPKVMPGTGEETDPTMPPKRIRPDRPVIDCMMSEFGPWSECSRTCGKGTMTRKRMVKQKARNGGERCGKTKEKKKCNLGRCPGKKRDRDCMMTEWGDWFPCTVTCGEGVQKRMRQIKRKARGNGAPCEPALEERVCINPTCER